MNANRMKETAAEAAQRQRIDDLARMGVIVGTPTPIKLENLKMHRSNTTAPPRAATTPPAPLPADPQKARDAFAVACGLKPGGDASALDAMWDACAEAVSPAATDPATVQAEGQSLGLSASEMKAIRSTPGATPATFLAAKRLVRGAR